MGMLTRFFDDSDCILEDREAVGNIVLLNRRTNLVVDIVAFI